MYASTMFCLVVLVYELYKNGIIFMVQSSGSYILQETYFQDSSILFCVTVRTAYCD